MSGHNPCMLLRCEGCNAICEYTKGWVAHLIDDAEEPEQDACVVVHCPSCAAREFAWVPRKQRDSSFPG